MGQQRDEQCKLVPPLSIAHLMLLITGVAFSLWWGSWLQSFYPDRYRPIPSLFSHGLDLVNALSMGLVFIGPLVLYQLRKKCGRFVNPGHWLLLLTSLALVRVASISTFKTCSSLYLIEDGLEISLAFGHVSTLLSVVVSLFAVVMVRGYWRIVFVVAALLTLNWAASDFVRFFHIDYNVMSQVRIQRIHLTLWYVSWCLPLLALLTTSVVLLLDLAWHKKYPRDWVHHIGWVAFILRFAAWPLLRVVYVKYFATYQ